MPINLITMCVIIIKQKGMRLPVSVAKSSARINPHGLGIIWLDTFEVTYHESKDYRQLDTKRPFIAHFRYATIGAINRENTHPFECGANSKEWLMMNGTIQGLGNAQISDTKALAISLGEIPRHTWKAELEKHPCRFVTINTRNRTYQIYNKHLWTQRDGIWFSKDNVLEEHLVAVYGTLKKGNSNYYHYLRSAGYLGAGQTKDRYPLIVDGLPYLIEKKGIGYNVDVDVFKVNSETLEELDRLEGHPRWYVRKQIQIQMKKRVLTCWIYFNGTEVRGNAVMHKSYEPHWKKPTPAKTYELFDSKYDYEHETTEFDLDFGDESKKPICIDCYNDLEFDGFNLYHCLGCSGWFSESEIITYS
jgi:gamma-glutamylaminecyclotransferase